MDRQSARYRVSDASLVAESTGKDEGMTEIPRPGGAITVNGVEYEIREVNFTASTEADGTLTLVTKVSTYPQGDDFVDVTIVSRTDSGLRGHDTPLS